jgi:hypothetical protein
MRSHKKNRGRPRIELDPVQVERLAAILCTNEEIGAVLGVSVDTLARRKQDDPEFVEALEIGKAIGRATLRRLQWQCANAGSDTMLIWLGKQTLGQHDKHTASAAAPLLARRDQRRDGQVDGSG